MRSIKKICKKLFVLALVISSLITIINVNAESVSNKITMASKSSVHYYSGSTAYIKGYKFYYKKTTDGIIGYCSSKISRSYPGSKSLSLKNEADKGLTYIINNGYPNKSFMNDNKKDFYITQSAIWKYFDLTRGQNNWNGYNFASAKEGTMAYYVNELAIGAVEALKSNNEETKPIIALSVESNEFTVSGEYNVTKLISANIVNNDGTYTVALNDAPEGTIIMDESGQTKTTFNNNEKFKVCVPVNANFESLSITATTSKTIYKIYEYTTGNSSYQDIVITKTYPETNSVSCSLSFNKVEKSQVTISKQDITTKKELPGATLVLKGESGNVIDTWVSETTPHYINNLSIGKYTLSETIAPKGYELTEETITFEITENGISKQIVMYNTPYTEVPHTALNASSIAIVLGSIISLLGMGLVFKNVKGRE